MQTLMNVDETSSLLWTIHWWWWI